MEWTGADWQARSGKDSRGATWLRSERQRIAGKEPPVVESSGTES